MPTSPTHPTQRLDVEDEDQRQLRLRQLLQRINDSSSSSYTHADNNSRIAASSNITPFVCPGPSSFDFAVRETHAVEPPSELLSRVESFLPQMETANKELAHRMESSPESVDIENLGDQEDENEDEDDEEGRQGQYIEMNLGLGVFDIRRRPISDTTTTSSSNASSDDDDSDSDTSNSTHSDEADSDSHSDSDASTSGLPGHLLNRPIRPLPKRARPNIVVLNESTTDTTHSTMISHSKN